MAKPQSQPRLHRLEPEAPASKPSAPAREIVSDAEVQRAIAETAYYRAEQRGFTPGCELEDWLLAEAEVNSRFGRGAAN